MHGPTLTPPLVRGHIRGRMILKLSSLCPSINFYNQEVNLLYIPTPSIEIIIIALPGLSRRLPQWYLIVRHSVDGNTPLTPSDSPPCYKHNWNWRRPSSTHSMRISFNYSLWSPANNRQLIGASVASRWPPNDRLTNHQFLPPTKSPAFGLQITILFTYPPHLCVSSPLCSL